MKPWAQGLIAAACVFTDRDGRGAGSPVPGALKG
jgi:hypothetical protein